MIRKGYRHYHANLGDDIEIDFYIMHMDADTDDKDNTTRDKNETKVGKQSANLGKNNEPIQNRLSFLIDCKSVILHHLTILSFPMVRPAWDNWWG